MSGVPAGETVHVRDDDGNLVLAYRSFASATAVVAIVMTTIVIVSGVAAAAFLWTEQRAVPGAIALMLAAAFAVLIAMLVPQTKVTIYDGAHPALTIAQQSSLSIPVATYVVATADGQTLARLRKSVFSRLGRNRWTIEGVGDAVEESFARAIVRKLFGKFSRRCQANMNLRCNGQFAGVIIRRPNSEGMADVLWLHPEAALDRRVAVALATLVFGLEP